MGGSSVRSRHEAGVVPPANSLASSRLSLGNLSAFDGNVFEEDIAIAENLLAGNPPRIPPRRSSFGHTGTSVAMKSALWEDQTSTIHSEVAIRRRRHNATSNTWTSSSGEISETDDIDSRTSFVQEYNKIANQYGVSALVPDAYEVISFDKVTISGKQGSWLMRRILKRTSSMLAIKPSQKELKHKRSISDLSLRMHGARNDAFKDKHLVELVRLCGSSPFYLPTEYAAGTLSLPTCFRATAQYLVQRGPTLRGIFRINGSHATVSALYDHYASQDDDGDAISGTVRCPTLPDNILCDEHDVASAFKKFLSGLPGGILGKVWLFEALVAIHNQLGVDPEWTKTRQTKVRARLIACAISSHPSRFQRDLICAVFGLLCMIGRAAETTMREDEAGRPLPTHGLMGYTALGTVFGPLLIGELIDEYDPRRQEKEAVESMETKTPPKKKQKHKKTKSAEESLMESKFASEKLKVANRVTEMVITHWRDIIRHMKNLGSMTSAVVQSRMLQEKGTAMNFQQPLLRPSASESFFLRKPPDWETERQPFRYGERAGSPTPDRKPFTADRPVSYNPLVDHSTTLSVRRQRSRPKSTHSQMLTGTRSMMNIMTPPREDHTEGQFDNLHARIYGAQKQSEIQRIQHSASDESQQSASQENKPPTKHSSSEGFTPVKEKALFGPFRDVKKSSPLKRDISKAFSSESSHNRGRVTRDVRLGPFNKPYVSHVENAETKAVSEVNQFTVGLEENSSIRPSTLPTAENEPPSVQRYSGPSPSEHLERMLSFHASPKEGNRRFVKHGATDPVHTKVDSRSSFTLSEECSLHRSYDASHVPGRPSYYQDPLKRISKAEDMASLASLGKALASSSEGSDDVHSQMYGSSSSNDDTVNLSPRLPGKARSYEAKPVAHRLPQSSTFDRYDGSDSSNGPAISRRVIMTLTATPSSPKKPFLVPTTPKSETRVGPSPIKGRMNSVKSLAARFENGPANKPNVSPTKSNPSTLSKRHSMPMTGLSASSVLSSYTANPSSVFSSYTINPVSPSPSRMSIRSNRSITQSQRQRRAATGRGTPTTTLASSETLLGKAHLANNPFRAATSSPRSPSRHRSVRNSEEERDTSEDKSAALTKALGQTLAFRKMPSLPVPGMISGSYGIAGGLPQGGDAHSSFGVTRPSSIQRLSSLGKILPRPVDPPVASHMPLQRVATSSLPRSSSSPALSVDRRASPAFSMVSPTSLQPGARLTPEVPFLNSGWQGRGTSMLYSQVTNLQKALEAKNEECELLKRQLATKSTLNDLGTLSEQLREAKREKNMWEKRALLAESRLERLDQVVPVQLAVKSENVSDGTLLTGTNEKLLQQSFVSLEMEPVGNIEEILETNAFLKRREKAIEQELEMEEERQIEKERRESQATIEAKSQEKEKASSAGRGSGSRSTMHGAGMDGAMSSEESERSAGTVLRRAGRSSSIDLLDFEGEESGGALMTPLMPVKTDSIHTEELYELA